MKNEDACKATGIDWITIWPIQIYVLPVSRMIADQLDSRGLLENLPICKFSFKQNKITKYKNMQNFCINT